MRATKLQPEHPQQAVLQRPRAGGVQMKLDVAPQVVAAFPTGACVSVRVCGCIHEFAPGCVYIAHNIMLNFM